MAGSPWSLGNFNSSLWELAMLPRPLLLVFSAIAFACLGLGTGYLASGSFGGPILVPVGTIVGAVIGFLLAWFAS